MRFSVQFNESQQKFSVQMKDSEKSFNAGFKDIQLVNVTPEAYEGDYSIVPKVDAQVIPTKRKMMRDDLTVTAIPTYEVHNPTGGTTFYIASTEELTITEG